MTRRLKHRFTPGAVILCYHRVGGALADPYSLSIRVERFEEQMEHLRRHAAPVHLSELVARVRKGAVQSGMVAVTFDDGYASVLDQAYPILLRLGIPATVFATSDYLGSARESWSDELEQILLQPGPLPDYLFITIDERPFHWHLEQSTSYNPDDAIRYRTWTLTSHHDPTSRHRLLRILFFQLLSLTETSRLAVLNQIARWAKQTPQPRPTHRFLSPDELATLAADPLMEIGSHSMSHPVLPKLSSQRQRDEIAGSREVLRTLTGDRIRTFSYPYGARSPETIQLVKQAGYDSACTTFADIIFASADPFQLPRVQIGDWHTHTFVRRLGLDTGG
jgi:peptidoglycan/xylan/chitin deacetylase (PgdA/CDA1 family)